MKVHFDFQTRSTSIPKVRVVPKEHYTCHDCGESQKSSFAPPIVELTFKILPMVIRSAKFNTEELRKLTATSLIANNAEIKEVN